MDAPRRGSLLADACLYVFSPPLLPSVAEPVLSNDGEGRILRGDYAEGNFTKYSGVVSPSLQVSKH